MTDDETNITRGGRGVAIDEEIGTVVQIINKKRGRSFLHVMQINRYSKPICIKKHPVFFFLLDETVARHNCPYYQKFC